MTNKIGFCKVIRDERGGDMRKKFKVFQLKYPHIQSLIDLGFTYSYIVEDLKNNHQLELNIKTFNCYIYRHRKNMENIENERGATNSVVSVVKHNQVDNVHNEQKSSYNQTSLESDKDDNENVENDSSIDSSKLSYYDKGRIFIADLLNEDNSK